MNVLSAIDSLLDAVSSVKDGIRRRIATTAIILCGTALVLCAVGFAIAAGYMWLAAKLPDYLAALSVAGGLVLVGCLVIAVAVGGGGRGTRRKRPAVSDATYDDIARRAEDAAGQATRQALSSVRNNPSSALLSALALGLVVGLLRPKDDR
jgi:hypothetical protein